MIDDATPLRRRPDAITAEVGDESVILDGERGDFLQLNVTGARIWALLEQPRTIGEVCAELATQHDAPPERIRADVVAFVAAIDARGLIVAGG